jgi:hypothetical protein
LEKQEKRVTVSPGELAFSNMMTLNALVELLDEKGVLKKQEVLERIKEIQGRTGRKPS